MIIDYELGERKKLTDCPNKNEEYREYIDRLTKKQYLDVWKVKVASDECRKCDYFEYFIKDNQVSCSYTKNKG